jgi:hypothetical protein
VTRTGAGEPGLFVAERATPEASTLLDRALASMLDRGRASLGSAWREALIAAMAEEGRTITKNQARAAVAGTSVGERCSRSHLTELPLDRLQALPDEVGRSLELLADLP